MLEVLLINNKENKFQGKPAWHDAIPHLLRTLKKLDIHRYTTLILSTSWSLCPNKMRSLMVTVPAWKESHFHKHWQKSMMLSQTWDHTVKSLIYPAHWSTDFSIREVTLKWNGVQYMNTYCAWLRPKRRKKSLTQFVGRECPLLPHLSAHVAGILMVTCSHYPATISSHRCKSHTVAGHFSYHTVVLTHCVSHRQLFFARIKSQRTTGPAGHRTNSGDIKMNGWSHLGILLSVIRAACTPCKCGLHGCMHVLDLVLNTPLC